VQGAIIAITILISTKFRIPATEGDVNIPRPGMLDFTGKAKWCVFPIALHPFKPYLLIRYNPRTLSHHPSPYRDAWDERKGKSKEEAWAKYVEKLLAVRCSCALINVTIADLPIHYARFSKPRGRKRQRVT
jgi:acyl-CoA-binding protein